MSIKTKLLIENILAKKTLSANTIFEKLIAEAEARRQAKAEKIVMEQDDDDLGDDDLDDAGDDDLDDDSDDSDDAGDDEGGDDEGGDDEDDSMSETESQDTIDDTLAIQCDINAKRITYMFDDIAALKQALEEKDLDKKSKEYIKADTTIAFYSDKLQEFQGKTNPGIDQDKLEEALDKISEALNQLKEELDIATDDTSADQVESPDEVEAEAEDDMGEDEEESEDEDEDLEQEEDQEESEDEDLEQEEGQEESDEDEEDFE